MTRRAHDDGEDPIAEIQERLRQLLSARDFQEIDGMLVRLGERSASYDGFGIENAAGQMAGASRDFSKARTAMDSLAMDATPRTAAGQAQYRVAARICTPIIGEDAALACDSAELLVRTTLAALSVPNSRHAHSDALPAMLTAALHAQRPAAGRSSPIGMFRPVPLAADGGDGFARRFPNVAATRRV